MWRRGLIILAVLAGLCAGTAIALKSDRVAANLEAYLVRLAAERFGATLSIGALTVELLPPGLALERLEATRAASGEPWLAAHRARVALRPWPSATGALVIDHLELDGLRGTLDLRRPAAPPEAPPRAPEPGPPPAPAEIESPSLGFDIGELRVWNTDLEVLLDEATLTVRRTDLTVVQSLRGRQVSLTVPDARLVRPGSTVGFETVLRGELLGSFDRPAGLEIARSWLALRQVTLNAAGRVELEGIPRFDLELRGRAPVARLLEAAGVAEPLGGELVLEARLHGTPAAPLATAQVSLTDLTFAGRALGQAALAATLSRDRVQLDSVRVDHPSAGAVTGSATIELTSGLPLTYNARLHRASLPHILELVGQADTWVPLQLSADARGSGSLTPFRLLIDLGGTVENFAVRDRSFRADDPFLILAMPQVDIQGGAEITTRAVNLRGITLSRAGSTLKVEGALHFNFDTGLDLHAASEQMNVADVGDIAAIPFAGRGAIGATIEGPYNQPTISGTVALEEFAVGGFPLGDVMGTLVVRDGVMAIERADIRRGEGLIQATGQLDLGAAEPRVRGRLIITRLAAPDLLQTLGVEPALAERFAASLGGEVTLQGFLARPDGTYALRSPQLRIDDNLVGELTLTGGFAHTGTRVWSDVVATRDGGELRGRVAWRDDGTLQARAETSRLSLGLLDPLLGAAALAGELRGTLALDGPPAALSGQAQLELDALAVSGMQLAKTALTARLDQGSLTVTGTTLDGRAALDATIRLGRHAPFTTTVTFRQLGVGALWPLPDDLQLSCTGTMFAQGDLTAPAQILADLRLDDVALAWRGLELTAARPLRVHWSDGRAMVDDLLLAGTGIQLGAVGSVSAAGELDLTIRGSGELKSAGAIGPMRWQRGALELDTRVLGSLETPRLNGAVEIKQGGLRLTALDEPFDNINARVVFAGRTASLETGSATWGGGRLGLSGRLLLPAAGHSDLDLRVSVANVTLRPQADLSAALSGDLNLVGPLDDLLLRGRLKLAGLQYTANLDLDRLIPRRNAPPLRVPAFDPDRAVRLAVGVVAANNVLLSSTMAEAEFRVDVTVTGTTERVGLIGTATPLWGRARYRNNEFVVERGTIDFVDEFRVATQFDLRATTQACGMKIGVDVHGNSSQYNVVPRGQDQDGPVSSEDVLACLQFGLRLAQLEEQMSQRQTAGEESNPLTSTVLASGLDALWAVSGMDVKVRKLLPIKLDQVRLESGWSTHFRRSTTRVILGKELGSNLQLRYARSLDELDDQTFAVEYQLSDVAAVQGTWISASNVSLGDFGLDLQLRWEFR